MSATLVNNWITEAVTKINCTTGAYSSFELRHLKLALNIKSLLEVDPDALNVESGILTGFSLSWVYDQIKCGTMLDGNVIAQAEAIVASKLFDLSGIAPITVYAAGTVYTLTATSALVDFGTTDPSIVINRAGKYIISARVQIRFAGATFAASQEVVTKLRRTNNTAADLTGSSTTVPTGIVTTQTGLLAVIELPDVVYETANITDIIKIFSSVAVAPSAGSVTITEASIIARPIL